VKAVREQGDELVKKVKKELVSKYKEKKERDQVIKDLGKEVRKVKERESRVKEEEEGKVKEMEEMREEVRELKEETNKSWAMTLGNAYIYLKDYNKAEPYFQEAVQKLPHHVEAWNNLGFCQIQNNQPKQAIKSFEEGLKMDRASEILTLNLIKLYNGQGMKKQALQLAKNFLYHSPNATIIQKLQSQLQKPPESSPEPK